MWLSPSAQWWWDWVNADRTGAPGHGTVGEVFAAFLRLGLTSFGGPIAHLGYFRTELVERRRWVDDREYADLVALCQFLPGPASSQVGFALGLRRAGLWGALAAFVAFTLPSAVVMIAFAFGASLLEGPIAAGVIDGLKIVAVAVVAHAVWGMARTLTPDTRRALIGGAALVIALVWAGGGGQLVAIAVGAVAGIVLCRSEGMQPEAPASSRVIGRTGAFVALAGFVVLVVGAPIVAALTQNGAAALVAAFSRAGALVFGGGHVVLPLLDAEVVAPGWVSADAFLAGYGVAQAVPGPLFTFAGYLGAISDVGPGGVVGGVIALLALFAPGFLLLLGVLPFWHSLRARPLARAALAGANAAVVGILAAALYTPVFTTAVTDVFSFALAAVCFVLLTAVRMPPWAAVLIGACGGVLLALV